VTLHGTDKRPGADREALEVRLSGFGRNVRAVVERVTHTDKITCVVDVHSPVLSGFVPSLVGSVGTEHQQETQATTRQREGGRGKGKPRDVVAVDDGAVVDLVEIVVSDGKHVPQKDNGRDGRRGGDFTSDVLDDDFVSRKRITKGVSERGRRQTSGFDKRTNTKQESFHQSRPGVSTASSTTQLYPTLLLWHRVLVVVAAATVTPLHRHRCTRSLLVRLPTL